MTVANRGSDLPALPNGFEVVWVDFPPNPLDELGNKDQQRVYESIRIDKGRRILAGLLAARSSRFLMTVDQDDFVSSRLTEFVSRNRGENGWFVRDGYVWNDGGRVLYRLRDFSHLCGTAHIVRSDLYDIPPAADQAADDYIRRRLGSHKFIQDDLKAQGTPLSPLPFFGAIYRVGHTGFLSHAFGIRRMYFNRGLIRRPEEALRRIFRLRLLTRKLRQDFFGPAI